eukprot:3022199-Lingulodinium_polyedra.AAC.1
MTGRDPVGHRVQRGTPAACNANDGAQMRAGRLASNTARQTCCAQRARKHAQLQRQTVAG